jgi:putative RNA 2'-phosphotransferase
MKDMDRRTAVKTSKFLSLVLRHRPEFVGIALDEAGWVEVDRLLEALGRHGRPLTRAELDHVVATNDKRRFALSDDGLRIRASQGHSVAVELQYEPLAPPELLYHGTAESSLPSIRRCGLRRGSRHHVHLSPDAATARRVGQRHGRPVVLVVRAGAMHAAGHVFYLSANGVWLTEHVPVDHLEFPESPS